MNVTFLRSRLLGLSRFSCSSVQFLFLSLLSFDWQVFVMICCHRSGLSTTGEAPRIFHLKSFQERLLSHLEMISPPDACKRQSTLWTVAKVTSEQIAWRLLLFRFVIWIEKMVLSRRTKRIKKGDWVDYMTPSLYTALSGPQKEHGSNLKNNENQFLIHKSTWPG